MIITYYGKQFFKIQQGDKVIALNPFSKDSHPRKKSVRFYAHIAISSAFLDEFHSFSSVEMKGKETFRIDGPGMYEKFSWNFTGYGHEGEQNGRKIFHTVYFIDIEGIQLCFLGALEDENLTQNAREHIENVDIIFVPIGGKGTLSYDQATRVIKDFEPKIIIPMDYGEEREKDSLKNFLKEMGVEKREEKEKLVIKKKDFEKIPSGSVFVLNEQ